MTSHTDALTRANQLLLQSSAGACHTEQKQVTRQRRQPHYLFLHSLQVVLRRGLRFRSFTTDNSSIYHFVINLQTKYMFHLVSLKIATKLIHLNQFSKMGFKIVIKRRTLLSLGDIPNPPNPPLLKTFLDRNGG